MSALINRRNLLKTGLLATVALPLTSIQARTDKREPLIGEPRNTNKSKFVKLNSNENPYGPCDSAKEALMQAMSDGYLYPRNYTNALKDAIAAKEGLSRDHILVTAGSTEILGLCGLYYSKDKKTIISEFPTFESLPRYSLTIGAKWDKIPVNQDLTINLDQLAQGLHKDVSLVYLCNPNNPTGTEVSRKDLVPFVESVSKQYPVMIDEAYIELSREGQKATLAPMVQKNKNLIVCRTFSKIHGLAGLRVGYGLAHPDTIKSLKAFLGGKELTASIPSLAAAKASLEDTEFQHFSMQKIEEAREALYPYLDKWGVRYAKSSTNFVIFYHEAFKNLNFRGELEKRDVLIRSYKFEDKTWCRVSMGKVEDIHAFAKEMESLIG